MSVPSSILYASVSKQHSYPRAVFLSPKQEKIDLLYLDLATRVGQESHAVRRKVGAVIAKGNSILEYGWNGMPTGADNVCEEEDSEGNLVTRPEVIHAEENALLKIASLGKHGVEGASIYCDYAPCSRCAARLVTAGIKKVVFRDMPNRDFGGLLFLLKSFDVAVYREVGRRLEYMSAVAFLQWLPKDGSKSNLAEEVLTTFGIDPSLAVLTGSSSSSAEEALTRMKSLIESVNLNSNPTVSAGSPFRLPSLDTSEATNPQPNQREEAMHTQQSLDSRYPEIFPVPAGHPPASVSPSDSFRTQVIPAGSASDAAQRNEAASNQAARAPYRTADQVSRDLEEIRREPQSNLTYYATKMDGKLREGEVFDYAGPALKIQAGMHHLDESLPNRQKIRSEEAFKAILEGVNELQAWMRAQGFNV